MLNPLLPPVRVRTSLALALVSVAAGLAFAQAGGAAAAPKSAFLPNARAFGQCEMFLLKSNAGRYDALVYNTTPLNDCPPAQFDSIDAKALAKKTGSDLVWKNPRRFWTMDRLTIALVGEPREFDGLKFNSRFRLPAH
jgi:hypothetical protein